jgi:hypothetical protein
VKLKRRWNKQKGSRGGGQRREDSWILRDEKGEQRRQDRSIHPGGNESVLGIDDTEYCLFLTDCFSSNKMA